MILLSQSQKSSWPSYIIRDFNRNILFGLWSSRNMNRIIPLVDGLYSQPRIQRIHFYSEIIGISSLIGHIKFYEIWLI